jgi:hypothetical protein
VIEGALSAVSVEEVGFAGSDSLVLTEARRSSNGVLVGVEGVVEGVAEVVLGGPVEFGGEVSSGAPTTWLDGVPVVVSAGPAVAGFGVDEGAA